MIRSIGSFVVGGAAAMCLATPAFAQQTVHATVGVFQPVGEDGRVDGDVFVENCARSPAGDCTFLDVNLDDLGTITIGAEYLFGLGSFVEAGIGVAFSQDTLDSRYADFVSDDPLTPAIEEDEIEQELKLRMVPLAFTVRVLPLGANSVVQPYFGGGIALIRWKYSEVGDFVDGDLNVAPQEYEDSGWKPAPLILGGIRFAVGALSIGGEFRWEKAEADLPPDQFLAPKVDLGGWTYQMLLGIRFD